MMLHLSAASHQTVQVRTVWKYNLEQEFALIGQFAQRFPYATIDTEFPGVVCEAPTHPRFMLPQERYALVKNNVDRLNLIQLGLTLCTNDSGLGEFITWEFNFTGFNPFTHQHSPRSIQFLESQGIDLWKNYHHGVEPWKFADLMVSSGLLCNPTRTWIGFHLAYDIAYMMKVLTGTNLPNSLEKYLDLVNFFLGSNIFDVKYMCKSCEGLDGGLERVAEQLQVQRITGHAHHAGSDSLLTWHIFKTLRATFFRGGIAESHAGVLFGIQES